MALTTLIKLNFYKTVSKQFRSITNFVSVNVDDKTGISTLSLQKPPVNSVNLDILTEILASLEDIEKNKSRGMILTSLNKNIFCAGMDRNELITPNLERFKKYWVTMQDIGIKLYGFSCPTIALINGHALGGGCFLALSCEYRVMLKNYTIGLNETHLGLVAPMWFISSMKNVIGQRQTEISLTTGTRYKTQDAFKIGLIDEVVENKEEGITRVEAFFNRFQNIPSVPRALSKKYNRKETIDHMINSREEDLNNLYLLITQSVVQEFIGAYLQSLKKKSS